MFRNNTYKGAYNLESGIGLFIFLRKNAIKTSVILGS